MGKYLGKFSNTLKLVLAGAVLATSGVAFADAWPDNIKLSNDFRFRTEYIDTTDGANGATDANPPRVRQRLRARLGLKTTLSDNLTLGLGLASGSDDPVSTNQSFDGGFSTKGFNLNKAYFKWQVMDAMSISGGKNKVAFHKPGKSELIWDGDLTLEGLTLDYERAMGDFNFGLVLGEYWAEENSKADDVILTGAQLNVGAALMGGDVNVNAGAGVYEYSNIKGHAPIFDATDSFGNTATGGTYDFGYHITQYYLEVSTKSLGMPLTVFYDAANNDSVDDLGSAHKIGLRVGKTKEKGSWSARLNTREVEADAVLGVFTDSDFHGGGTDGKGLEFGADYQLADKAKVSFTWFENETAVKNGSTYQRGQLDFVFKL